MKKRVRLYKAQMGGYQAAEGAAPQQQLSDEELINVTMKMLSQGSQPQAVMSTLVENGIEQEKAAQAVKYSVDYIQNAQQEEFTDVTQDEQAQEEAALQEQLAQKKAEEEAARKARMQELYGLTDDSTAQDYSDDDEAMMDMMRYGGLPSKRTYVKNAVKLAKKQMGGQEQPAPGKNKADNTDTGERQAKLQKFVGSLQNHANEALMKQEAEAAYEQQMQMMQQQNPFMPMAQEGGEDPASQMNPRQQRQMARQQRQMGRQMNRMIGNIPVGLYNNRGGGLPTNIGVINMPAMGTAGLQSMIQGAQSMMPAQGSIYGGPKLANIDVRKTGLFGRPKQYSITFAQDVVTNPTTAENAVKQESYNIKEEAKEVEEKITTAAEDVKKADEATKAAEETAAKSSSGTSKKTGSKKSTPVKSKTATSGLSDEEQLIKDFTNLGGLDKIKYLIKLKNSPGFSTNPYKQQLYDRLSKSSPAQYTNTKPYPIPSAVLNPHESPYSALNNYGETGSPSLKNSILWIDQPIAAYEGWKDYLGYQQGGFTDEQSGLYKFVYGGDDMYMPAPNGRVTDDPYFQYGGLKRYAEGDEIVPVSGSGTEADPKVIPEVKVTATPNPWAINPKTGKVWTIDEWNARDAETSNSKNLKLGDKEGYYINPATGKSYTDEEWANRSTTENNTGYNYGYNTGVGPIYPPLFGGGRGRGIQNLLNLTPYGANPLVSYAGTWAQQKGLPIDPATGQPYTGDFANPQIAKINVTKSGLFGRPKRYSIDYMVDDTSGAGTTPAGATETVAGYNPTAAGPAYSGFNADSDGNGIPDYLQVPNAQNQSGSAATTPDETSPELTDETTGIKNYKMKEFMSRIPGVRRMINWGDLGLDSETEPAAAKESVSYQEAMKNQRAQMEENIAAEERGDIVAPVPPGEEDTLTPQQRMQVAGREEEPMLEGLPEGTPEEIDRQLEQQRYASGETFMNQAGPTNEAFTDQAVADYYGVPASMVDQYAYQENLGPSGFDLNTQAGFDKQQYLNESLGRETMDVNQRPTIPGLDIMRPESLDTQINSELQGVVDYKSRYPNVKFTGNAMEDAALAYQYDMKTKMAAEAEAKRKAAAAAAAQKAKANAVRTPGKTTTVKSNNYDQYNTYEKNNKLDYKDQYAMVDILDFGKDLSEFNDLGLKPLEVQNILQKSLNRANKDNSHIIKQWYNLAPKDRPNFIKSVKKSLGTNNDVYRAIKALSAGMTPSKKHGGLHKAQSGVITPVSVDPRFLASYNEMMQNIADEEAGLLVPPPIQGEQDQPTLTPEQKAQVVENRQGPLLTGLPGEEPGRKKVTVNYKNKNMWTIDPLVGVNTALAGAQGLTRFLNTRDERKREQELARSLTADNVYGTRSSRDKGTYDINSGLFRQNEMGFTGVAKYGGAPFKEGGTTYMSADQVRKFLEEGGELEFV